MTRTKLNPRNADGSFKTLDQLMRSQMTVLQYGRFLSEQKGGRQ